MENNIIMLEDEHGCMIEFETIDVFEFEGGCMQDQCSEQLSSFFKMRREQKKQAIQLKKSLNDATE